MKISSKKNQYFLMTLLVIIFFGPLFLSYYLYLARPAWMHNTTNRGELIIPIKQFSDLNSRALMAPSQFSQKSEHPWQILVVTSLPCNQSCQSTLYTIRQLYLTFLPMDRARLQPVVAIFSGEEKQNFSVLLSKEYPQFSLIELTTAHYQTVFPNVPLTNLPRVYFVDPRGNMMMQYNDKVAPKNIQKDLQKLLKASKIG